MMQTRKTISQEMLAIGAKSKIGEITEKMIRSLRSLDHLSDPKREVIVKKYRDDMANATGVGFTFEVDPQTHINAWASCGPVPYGHSGVRWYDDKDFRMENWFRNGKERLLEVDLKNVRIKGDLLKISKNAIGVTFGLLQDKNGLSDREVAAIILHEVGHIFNLYVFLGDYVWMNYYLTDGVEILQGNKNSTIKIQMLDEEWLKENVPEDTWSDFANDRNEANARRVILSAVKHSPRHHLTNNSVTAIRREEQMADMFATRLGYGKDLAVGLHRMDKVYNAVDDTEVVSASNTLYFASLLFPVTLPFAVLFTLWSAFRLNAPNLKSHGSNRYDSDDERLRKIRRDLIAQLRSPVTSPSLKEQLSKEIDIIEELISEYVRSKHWFTAMTRSLNPTTRRLKHNTKTEEDLESLLNNDLFVKAFQSNKLQGKSNA